MMKNITLLSICKLWFNFQREKCGLVSLALAGCEMSKVGANHLLEGLRENTSLTELNVNGLEVP